MSVTEPIRSKKDLENLANYYYRRGELRNYVLVVPGSGTALRISDLLKLRWEDVYDFACGKFRDHVTLTEQKTKKEDLPAEPFSSEGPEPFPSAPS